MLCPSCQADNRGGRRFCSKCGASLGVVCGSCSFANEPDDEFCGGCGARLGTPPPATARFTTPSSYTPKHLADKILTSKAALEGERKQVTVLFADLKGSMELLGDRDPEEARKILDAVVERMMEAVHRYEGTVSQVMGDGIMALFGAPVAHEDHAARACYAALRMRDSVKRYAEDARHAHGVSVQIRVGLNSGEVVVRAIGSDLRMDYTAVGQTTHLAARMEQLATPGTIVITPATLALVEDLVAVTSLGSVPVKGLADPVEVFEVTGVGAARTRLHAAARRGLTRFVGRDAELEQLWRAQELAGKGRGQVVAVVGEAGVGKSRLCWEFSHSHRLRGSLLLESGAVSHGRATPYLPIIDLLRTYFHVEARDETRRIREKVTGKVLSLDRALEPFLSPLLWLLEVPAEDEAWGRLEPTQRRQLTLDAVKHLLLRESQVQPVILLLEDLHWIDPETQKLLDHLVESLPTARLLLLASYRPEYRHAWDGKTSYQQLRIDPLPEESAADLLESLLGSEPSLDPLKRMLIERAEGNPLFLEEIVRSLVEGRVLVGERGAYRLASATQTVRVPATVQAILAARIDRLSSDDKQLLQMASVIGKDVPLGLLRAITAGLEADLRAGLGHLQAAEFLYESKLFPDVEYTFKHALTHDVAYGSLLQEQRRYLHAQIVDAIETLHRDRLGEHIEQLAHHAFQGATPEKAVSYLRQAGAKAADRSALQEARAWYEDGLALLAPLPESPFTLEQAFEIHLALRSVLFTFGDVRMALDHLREAEALAERSNDDHRRGRVCVLMINAHSHLDELDEALATGARSLEIATRLGDLRLRLLTTVNLEQAHYFRGDYTRMIELANASIAALPADMMHEAGGGFVPISVYDRYRLIHSFTALGRFAEATPHAAEGLRLAESTRRAYTIGLVLEAVSILHRTKGDWAQARSLCERSIATWRTGNVSLGLSALLASSAVILAQVGERSEALARLQESQELYDRDAAKGYWHFHRLTYYQLGRASLSLGRLDEAQRLGDRALEHSSSHHGAAAHARLLMGDIATHPERFDAERGEAHYRHALALAEPRGMRPLIAHCHLGLGKLYRRTGKRDQAQEHLTTATTMYREMDMRFWLNQAETAHESSG